MIAWTRLELRKRYQYSFQRSVKDRYGREEYTIRLPGWSGELRKLMTQKECDEFIAKNNGATYEAVAHAARINGERGFSKNGFTRGAMTDVMINIISKSTKREG